MDGTFTHDAELLFFQYLHKHPERVRVLPHDEVSALCKQVQRREKGWEDAQRKLIHHNLLLVIRIANKYVRGTASAYLVSHYRRSNTLSTTDLIQAGVERGLVRAIEKYEPRVVCDDGTERQIAFSTYAGVWIQSVIEREIELHGSTIHTHPTALRKIAGFSGTKGTLTLSLSRNPTDLELAQVLNIPVPTVRKLHQYAETLRTPSDSFSPHAYDDSDSSPYDMLSIGDPAVGAFQELALEQQQHIVASLLARLTERDRDILARRYGFGYDKPQTLDEVAGVYNLSRERIRQLQHKAEQKLRDHLTRVGFSFETLHTE